ncbi:pentapeptide repeat-containing protein [Erwinia sp. V71]|uniref:pentapeptide repeat-containing protein n=1 Tax=Erwinia sp. V71 TaxID=3369424 RepID=UPI003F5DCF65
MDGVTDNTITLFHSTSATPLTLTAAMSHNLIQASNVRDNLTPIAPLPAGNITQSHFTLASTSRQEIPYIREQLLFSAVPGQVARELQPTRSPSETPRQMRSTSFPYMAAFTYQRSAETKSARSPSYLKAATYPRTGQKVSQHVVRDFAGPLDLLRAPIAETLSAEQRETELQRKITVLDRVLEYRLPGVTLELAGLDLRNLDFGQLEMSLENVHFLNCQFDGASLNATFTDCKMTLCTFTQCNLSSSRLTRCRFFNCNLRLAIMERCHLFVSVSYIPYIDLK